MSAVVAPAAAAVVAAAVCDCFCYCQHATAIVASLTKPCRFFPQHIFIPVLPESLVDYISAPMPYLIGVPADLFDAKVSLTD